MPSFKRAIKSQNLYGIYIKAFLISFGGFQMRNIEQKLKHLAASLKTTKNVVVDGVMYVKDSIADKMINTGLACQAALTDPEGFVNDQRGTGQIKPIAMLIVGGIVVIKLASTLLPQSAADWSAATATGGAMANASASDKSTWNTGGSLIPVFGILIVAGLALRAFGH